MKIRRRKVRAICCAIKHFPSKKLQERICYSCSVRLSIVMKDNVWWQHSSSLYEAAVMVVKRSMNSTKRTPFLSQNTVAIHILTEVCLNLFGLLGEWEFMRIALLFLHFRNWPMSHPLWQFCSKNLLLQHGSAEETLRQCPFAVFCDGQAASRENISHTVYGLTLTMV